MKKLIHLLIVSLLGVTFAQAQTVIPYLPMQNDFGGSAVGDLAAFEPSLSEFTLEVTANALGSPVGISMLGVTYTPQTSTAVRFVLFKGEVYIYEGGEYKETQTPSVQIAYGGSNLLLNPSFETVVPLGSVWKDGVYWNAYTDAKEEAWGASSSTSIRKMAANGTYSMLMHSNARYLTQQLAAGGVKPNTYYKIAYKWAEASGNNDGGLYSIRLGSSEFGTDYLVIPAHTVTDTNNAWRDFETTFKTDANVDINNPVWFAFHRSNSKVDYIDYVQFVEGTPTVGITGAASASYAADVVAAPEFEPDYEAGDAFDMTDYFVINGDFSVEPANTSGSGFAPTGWTKNFSSYTSKISNAAKGSPVIITGDPNLHWQLYSMDGSNVGKVYQIISGLFAGKYKVTADIVGAIAGVSLYANAATTELLGQGNFEVQSVILSDDNLEIGLNIAVTKSYTIDWDNVRLFYYGPDYPSQANALLSQVASAQTLSENPMNEDVKSDLEAKILAATAAATAEPLVPADLETTATELNDAIAIANTSVAAYAVLNDYLTSAEATLDTYSGYSGYAAYDVTISDARDDYNEGVPLDTEILTVILSLKMAKNNCIYSDGPIHAESNLLYGWDANEQEGITPEDADWIASKADATWGSAQSGPNDGLTAYYRTNALSHYAFMGYGHDNDEIGTIITYAYPVYLESGKNYLFTGKNWRRNGQDANSAANVTFAISSTADASGTILGQQTVYCAKEGYDDYSFGFTVSSTGVYYLIRYADKSKNRFQDASADLLLEEAYKVAFDLNGGEGEVAPQYILSGAIVTAPDDPERTGYIFKGWKNNGDSWDFTEGTVSEDMTLTAQWEKDPETSIDINKTDKFQILTIANGIKIINNGAQTIRIYAVTGQLLKQLIMDNEEISIPLNSGLYIVNGKKVIVK